MGSFVSLITSIFTSSKDKIVNTRKPLNMENYYSDKMQIVHKYYLKRLFDNFDDDMSPKHFIALSLGDADSIYYDVRRIIYELNFMLHGKTKYKLFVKNGSYSGNCSFSNMKEAISIGLLLIDNKSDGINHYYLNMFINHLFACLIEMFKSIDNLSQHANIINDTYFLLKDNPNNTLTLKQKVDDIQFILFSLEKNDDMIKKNIDLIYLMITKIK